MPNPIINTRTVISSVATYDASASAYFAALPTPLSAARKAIVNTLVTTLKADGNWTDDRLWLLASPVQDQALISLVNPSSTAITLVNAPSFTADQGITSDGSTSYMNLNFAASTDGVNYTRNNCGLFLYSRTNNAAGQDMGSNDSVAGGIQVIAKFSDNNNYCRINNTAAITTVAQTNTLGLFSGRRTDANTIFSYENGVQIATNAASGSEALTAYTNYGCCYNTGAAPFSFTTRQYSIMGFGAAHANELAFYNAIQTYMTSLGTQV